MRIFSSTSETLSAVLSIIIIALTASSNSLSQTKTPIVSIAEAEKMPLGATMTIEGTVTVASGTFKSSFDDEGFQIQDKTGGTYVAVKADLHLKPGQKVRVFGKIAETALKFQIVETDESLVRVLNGTARVKPIKIKTGKISANIVGRLIKVSAIVTNPIDEVAPYGFRLPIDDGSGEIIAYVSTSTGVSSKQFVIGQRVEFTGVAGQFNGHYQIYPRSQSDVEVSTKAPRN
jgi:DNA/RNA endonuclease YhcR with UshA esterase domain